MCMCITRDGGDCTCQAMRILDENGNYSMDQLRSVDKDWFTDTMSGTAWEILDSAMDIEEPDAAHIISIALNRKSASALVTGHMEIMRTLVALCEPHPKSHEVPFEPVKVKLIQLFGSVVDSPAFVKAYELVLKSGGSTSPTFQDLFNWADYVVDEEYRKWRPDSYQTFALYPAEFPNIVKMHLKHVWSQKPQPGSTICIAPTSLAHRLKADSKYAWRNLANDIEDVSRNLPKFGLAMMSKNDQVRSQRRRRTKQLLSGIPNWK